MSWQIKLLDWYQVYKRDFPWRQTKDPYKIWLSEIIMQQTRTQQGLPYYNAFVSSFPCVADLAKASEEQVLKLWQGLGYYSRARNLHATAKVLYHQYDSVFPTSFQGLMALKGVGDYTASAIASIAYDLPEAVVDGNVYRVYARFFGIDLAVPSSAAFKRFKDIAQQALFVQDPGTFNQAVMELGALICTPKKPSCATCPLSTSCKAYAWNRVTYFPVKVKKLKIKKRYFNYLVFRTPENNWFVEQRIQTGIWHKLYQFPLVETPKRALGSNPTIRKAIESATPQSATPTPWGEPLLHKLTHQHIEIQFWRIEVAKTNLKPCSLNRLNQLAVPVPIANFLKEIMESEI